MKNLIDKAAGLSEDSAIFAARRQRPEFVDGTEACRASILSPENDLGLTSDFRAALAARLATAIGQPVLGTLYRDYLSKSPSPVLQAIANGDAASGDPVLVAMVRHADLVTQTPRQSCKQDIEALAAAGLTNPQIVAISELVAFVNYEARVVAGLALLEHD
jgi:uncharacterized protein YciW